MDPILQRLGDVTIQRLEKPKENKPEPPPTLPPLPEKEELPEAPSFRELIHPHEQDDSQGVKRNVDELPGPSQKKTKYEFPDRKDDLSSHSFSDGELSEYESESEMESDGEIGMPLKNKLPEMDQENTNSNFEEESQETPSTDFLEKLVQEPFLEESEIKIEPVSKDDDYDYDIKEKLKEMGEISFETVKKGDSKPKKPEITENEVSVMPAKKNDEEGTSGERKAVGGGGGGNLRRNIREVMDETKLDESTLAAQRQEMERLRRVQEQQRLIREVQRQMAQERMLSLLSGSNAPKAGPSSGSKIGNTVLVKLPNGQTKPMTKLTKKPLELMRVPKGAVPPHKARGLIPLKKPLPQANLTPSVSIAPVGKRPMTMSRPPSESDSDNEDSLLRKPLYRPKQKEAPVTTIDISSDDDCIVVSESENDHSDEVEDPTNSGMHTNDEFNQPDEQGRVVINVGHPEDESDIYLAPQIARIIKPHQIGGIRFLYDNIIESTNRFESSSGFGCILAHSMGLGKTLQVVTFSDIFLRHTPAKTILCIMPINTLQNWLAEYNMWLPAEEGAASSPLLAHGEVRPRHFNLHVLNDSHKTLAARAKVIHEWKVGGGVLLIGYEQYRLLSLRKYPKSRSKKPEQRITDEDRNKLLFDEVHEALVKPGPDLVICDEGHRIKNSHASISQALKQMRTKRRVVLTGYPLQNNLMEYWCMVDFVRPNYLGTKTEFCNMFERPIQNGQCIDSTESDIKLMRYRAHVLHSLLLGFVQRRSHRVLQTALPQKEEYVLLVRMTDFQRTLYETFMNEVVRTQTVPNPLKAFAVCCKIWNHPDVLYYFLKKQAKGEAVDIDLEEVSNSTNSSETPAKTKSRRKAAPKGKNAKPAASITPYNAESSQSNNPQSSPSTQNAGNSFPNPNPPPIPSSAPNNFNSNSNSEFSNQSFSNRNFPETQNKSFPEQQNFPASFNENSQNSNSSYNNSQSSNFNNPQPNFSNFNQNQSFGSQHQQTPNYPNQPQNYTNQPPNFPNQQNQNQSTNFPNQQNQNYPHHTATSHTPNYPNQPQNFNPNTTPPNYPQNTTPYNTPPNQPFKASAPNSNYNSPQNQNFTNAQSSNFGQNNQPNFNFQNQSYWNTSQDIKPLVPNNENYYNNFGPQYAQNQSMYQNNQWIKKEDHKPLNIHMTPIKSECSTPDIKPKINIISDIKITGMYDSMGNISPEKKINIDILSDIHIKKEEPDFKTEFKEEIKQEMLIHKPEMLMHKPEICIPKPEMIIPKPDKLENDEELKILNEMTPAKATPTPAKEDTGIPYDWAIELLKDYVPGCIENSAKMQILFCIIKESLALGDRLLVFSQSLITLDLIELFLQKNIVPGEVTQHWAKNVNYYRLDGSTSALEREKLINEFNSNSKVYLFLVSTRAGSLGINLIGANRVVVLDASWNPCHDTQAVCRVYRYGQRKPCFVYRLVVDNCLEKKIYDRQINKQGMSDRVVDECNPDAHLTMKDVSTLCWDDERECEEQDWSHTKDNYIDVVLQKVLVQHGRSFNKEPFQHESLLIDRKDKQLSQQEKRLAKKGYEREKQASRQPSYGLAAGARGHRPVASVRPMQQGGDRPTRWIPAEHWQRQGMTAQEMTLPLDVVIPTNQPDKGNIVLKAGQKVLVLKSPKGVYMQLESGKIVAIKTAIKVRGKAEDDASKVKATLPPSIKNNSAITVMPQKRPSKPFNPGMAKLNMRSVKQAVPNLVNQIQKVSKKVQMARTKPYHIGNEIAKAVRGGGSDVESHPISSSEDERMPDKRLSFPFRSDGQISLLKPQTSRSESDDSELQRSEEDSRDSKDDGHSQHSFKQFGKQAKTSSSALQQLEQSTSAIISEKQPFQETLDSITSSYQDDKPEEPISQEPPSTQTQPIQIEDDSPVESEDVYESSQPPPSQDPAATATKPTDIPPPDYGYNNYYGYNHMQPYPPPPPQGYPAYPPQHPPYDMNMYPPQQQPPYNYGYQGYPPPPQPQYPPPPQPYDYGPPPPQPPYGAYPPYPPQQYPPPPQGMYPPPAPAAAPYPDYQYPPAPAAGPPPPGAPPYYPPQT